MNPFKKAKDSAKKFVDDHKVGLAVIGTAFVCLKINRWALQGHDNFLKEHGLYDEYYTLQD